jgi:hypothetical protein
MPDIALSSIRQPAGSVCHMASRLDRLFCNRWLRLPVRFPLCRGSISMLIIVAKLWGMAKDGTPGMASPPG